LGDTTIILHASCYYLPSVAVSLGTGYNWLCAWNSFCCTR